MTIFWELDFKRKSWVMIRNFCNFYSNVEMAQCEGGVVTEAAPSAYNSRTRLCALIASLYRGIMSICGPIVF